MTKLTLVLTFAFLALNGLLIAQTTATITPLTNTPGIDGVLDETEWAGVTELTAFTTSFPQFGNTPQSATSVKMGYTADGIFISAVCKAAIARNEGSLRDDRGTGDYFSVGFDTWNDDQNAFIFTVTAGGQIIDNRTSSNQDSYSFDTPWKARTTQQADGWTVEIYIPFRAMRYPRKGEQNWGLQFTRSDPSTGETSTWSPQDPLIRDIQLQYGALEGLVIGAQKVRVGLTNQSIANYKINRYNTTNFAGNPYQYSKGIYDIHSNLDGRWGPTSATTFDFSIVPALMVQKEERPLIQFDHHPDLPGPRPLQAEESGIFNKTQPLRHINGFPAYDLQPFSTLPQPLSFGFYDEGHLISNIKMTTRLANNVGIGIANTVSTRSKASFFSLAGGSFETINTQKFPVTNQISIEKLYRKNSWIQLSNIHEAIGKGKQFNIATVAGQWRDKTNQYEVAGKLSLETLSPNFTKSIGNAAVSKVNGTWNWGVNYYSPDQHFFNPDYFIASNVFSSREHLAYSYLTKRSFKPRNARWLNTARRLKVEYTSDEKRKTDASVNVEGSFSALNRRFNRSNIYAGFSPLNREEKLYYANEILHRKIPQTTNLGYSWRSDERKRLIGSASANIIKSLGSNEDQYDVNSRLQYVPKQRWVLRAFVAYSLRRDSRQAIIELISLYGVEKVNTQTVRTGASIQYALSPQWILGAGLQYYAFDEQNKRAYIVDNVGQLIPINHTSANNQNNTSLQPSCYLNWYISSLRQIRFSYNIDRNKYYENFFTPGQIGGNLHQTFSVKALISLYD
jgi:hypothetical protein